VYRNNIAYNLLLYMVLDFANNTLSRYDKKYFIKLSDLLPFTHNVEEARKALDTKGDYAIYEVIEIARPGIEGELNFRVTTIFPGSIVGEYHFIRGITMLLKLRVSYIGLSDNGLLLLQNIKGISTSTQLKKAL